MAVVATGCGAGRAAGHLTAQPTSAPQEPLAAFIEKTKEVQTRASTQPVNVLGTTVETFDTELGAALFQAKLHPTSAAARRVAAAYARLGIFDKAHEYLQRAVKSDPGNAANYEALARLWRDVRMPYLGLSDAHRAVYY